MLLPLYLLALTALLVGASSLYMPMIKAFPVTWIYYLSFVSRPIVWAILVGSGASTLWLTFFPTRTYKAFIERRAARVSRHFGDGASHVDIQKIEGIGF